MPRGQKTKAEQYAEKDYAQVVKEAASKPGGWEELRKQVETMRRGINIRANQFARRGVYSHAFARYIENQPLRTAADIQAMNKNQLIHQFIVYQNFFTAKTSSIEGIARVNRAQDARIFGVNKRGLPKRRMTEDQRRKYWELYDEFRAQHPNITGSPKIQQMLASLNVLDSDDPTSFQEKIDQLYKAMVEQRNKEVTERAPNVYTANGFSDSD